MCRHAERLLLGMLVVTSGRDGTRLVGGCWREPRGEVVGRDGRILVDDIKFVPLVQRRYGVLGIVGDAKDCVVCCSGEYLWHVCILS